jgi:hypothetical protein
MKKRKIPIERKREERERAAVAAVWEGSST